jgi:fatty acid amide hydrolase
MAAPAHDVVRLGLRELSARLQQRSLSSVEVTEAFLARLDALSRGGGAPRPLPALARALAKESDARRARGEARSPLDGVPLTLDERLDLAGQPSALGQPARSDPIADRDAAVVAILRDAGAVFLGKCDVDRTGHAAALAAGGSPSGVGADVGGSLRIGAAFSGACGLKPTTDRWSCLGSHAPLPGVDVVRAQPGPLGRTVDDLALLLDVVTPERCARHDPRTAPLALPPHATVDVTKLRVGILVDDGLVKTSPAVARALREAADLVRDAGAYIEPVAPLLVEDAAFTWLALASSASSSTSSTARRAAALARAVAGDRLAARAMHVRGPRSLHDVTGLVARAQAIAAELLQTWERLELDVVLCPAHATPAPPAGVDDFALASSSSIVWSVAGFPAGVVPVTAVRPDETGAARAATFLEKKARLVDDASGGLPVGVQVVARPFREEHALAAMAVIEAGARGRPGFPGHA